MHRLVPSNDVDSQRLQRSQISTPQTLKVLEKATLLRRLEFFVSNSAGSLHHEGLFEASKPVFHVKSIPVRQLTE